MAHREHMGVRPKEMQKIDEVIDVIIEIELILGGGNHAAVAPIGDVDVVIRQHRLDGAPHECREVSRKRCTDQ